MLVTAVLSGSFSMQVLVTHNDLGQAPVCWLAAVELASCPYHFPCSQTCSRYGKMR